MARRGLLRKAVAQGPMGSGLNDGPHFCCGHNRSGMKDKVRAFAVEFDDHEEFSAGGESDSQAESWIGERISTRRIMPRWQYGQRRAITVAMGGGNVVSR